MGRRYGVLATCMLVVMALALWLAPALAGSGEPLYVALIWHNHQPFYKNTATGMYMMPWVRMHAVKDYYDMVSILKDYPNVHATFNLVPSLILQLDEYVDGAQDIQLILSLKPASELANDDKDFILRRFFDANWDNIIKKYPRYWQLLNKRGQGVSDESIAAAIEAYDEQDFRDLQVWFNLAWLDPDFIDEDPNIEALVRKGRDFTEEDKRVVLDKHDEIIRKVIPIHREMQKAGQIEVTTTPFYHPIMPLLYDVELARVAGPKLDLPMEPFAYPEDVEAQLAKAVKFYEDHFGMAPRGLWPSEQAVGQSIVGLVHDAGFEWMVSSEGILARSLGIGLRDGGGRIVRPDVLYKPYIVEKDGKEVAILFRDIVLSDKIGFSYSGMSGRAAARDLMDYLESVRRSLASTPGPHVVTIALDGENCWEYYENDGKEFLHTLYGALNDSPDFKTVTVEEYLAAHPATDRIPHLHTGSWISDDLETWIGEVEENRAWDYLAKARMALADFTAEHADSADDEIRTALGRAWEELYAAEGSDWFWWYGDDQDSGNDEAFDELFRIHLQNVYSYIGLPVPNYLYMPIIPKQAAVPEDRITGLMHEPAMDGFIDWGEWEKSSFYPKDDAAVFNWGEGENIFSSLRVGVDNENLYLRIRTQDGFDELYGKDFAIAAYLTNPRRHQVNTIPRWSPLGRDATVLGFAPGTEILVDFAEIEKAGRPSALLSVAAGDDTWTEVSRIDTVGVGEALEISAPFDALGMKPADVAHVVVVASTCARNIDMMPTSGPAEFKAPVVTVGRRLFRIEDPRGDDHGPGTYTYPTNPVFTPSVFDMLSFEAIDSGEEVVFKVELAAEIVNHWNSGIGLSVQTIDIYIDTDNVPGSGFTKALGGRRVEFEAESAWEYAIWVEGWNQRVFLPEGGDVGGVTATVDTINNVVAISVPKDIIGEPQPGWGYQIFVLGQEGFPSEGNLRVREVLEHAAEWRFGGGDNSVYDPNVIDMLAPPGQTQEEILSAYDVSTKKLAVVPMIYPDWE